MKNRIEAILFDMGGTLRRTTRRAREEQQILYRMMSLMGVQSREVVLELFRRGYRLGLVSNTTSSVEVPALLKELEITGCFETVLVSSVIGKRKPDPAILLDASQRMGVAPERCAYIGDRMDRPVAAARKAGFSEVVILHDPRQPKTNGIATGNLAPDHSIKNLKQLLDLFPPLAPPQPKPVTVSNASLSTMWAIRTFPTLKDFFEFARRMGFARIELNHKVTSQMLAGIDLSRFEFSSVHEPAPADISADDLKKRDWLVSSVNEDCRRAGVKAIQRSVDLAARIGASTVVIHAGHVDPDTGPEKKLRSLIESGRRASDEYREIHQQMLHARAARAEASFESVKKSIIELLTYSQKLGIRLGIENRYHYMEFPSPDELQILLGLADRHRIGFIYDVGHAQALDLMGFYPHEDWLKRFAPRMIGTHLHDVLGTTDHYAPGLGNVDFDRIARYLPAGAFRTCEFQMFNTPEQVKAGLEFLIKHGCVKPLSQKEN
jgi:FMN phosphatase YigB (HAD superfamily)/sugar phosphate isomerase/epimerase